MNKAAKATDSTSINNAHMANAMETFQIEKSSINNRTNPHQQPATETVRFGQSFSPARDLSDLKSKLTNKKQTGFHVRVSNSLQPATPNVQVIGNSVGGGIQRPSSLDKYPHTLPRTDPVDLTYQTEVYPLNSMQKRAMPTHMMAQTFTGKMFQGFGSRKHSDATPTIPGLTLPQ